MPSVPKALSPRTLRLLVAAPREFADRATDELERLADLFRTSPPDLPFHPWPNVLSVIERETGLELSRFADEPALAEVEQSVVARMDALEDAGPFPLTYNSGLPLARLAYTVCRATRPSTVLETGVAYGVTTAFVLKALAENGRGSLHSIDRPPWAPEAERFVGYFVPRDMSERWTLHAGTTKRVLPRLLPELRIVDLLVRDSLYTYPTVLRELRAVTPFLSSGAVVLSDDVEQNEAFRRWAGEMRPAFWTTLGCKAVSDSYLAGVAVTRTDDAPAGAGPSLTR
jgi:predicted O-methyltransferase YrrM